MFPTHGFGSFCSATQSDATDSTIGQEKQNNPVLTESEETYVELLGGLDAYPAYYVHMAPANAAGPTAPDLSLPAMAEPEELRRRIEAGEWVVDLRNRTVFAAGHMPGTLNFGIDGGFATYLGWLIEWGTPLTLLGETEDDVTKAQRELVRIGIDRPAAAATGGPEDWTDRPLSSFRQATFADLDLVRHHRDVVILDVRREPEFAAARIEGALNIPLHELPKRVNEVPDAGEVWVHCAGGYRAAVAASFLSAANRKLVAIDDTFDNAKASGLHLITAEDDAAQSDNTDDDDGDRRHRGRPRQGRRPVMIRKLLALFTRPSDHDRRRGPPGRGQRRGGAARRPGTIGVAGRARPPSPPPRSQPAPGPPRRATHRPANHHRLPVRSSLRDRCQHPHPPRLHRHQPHRWHERLGQRRPARHHQRRQARPGHLTPQRRCSSRSLIPDTLDRKETSHAHLCPHRG